MASRSPLVLMIFTALGLSLSGCGGTTRTIDKSFPAASTWFEGAPGSIAVLPGDDVPLLSLSSLEGRSGDTGTASAALALNTVGTQCGPDPISGCNDAVLTAPSGSIVGSVNEPKGPGSWSEYDSPSLQQANEQLKHTLADRRPQLLVSHAVVSRIRARTAYDAQLKPFRGYPEEFAPDGPFNGLVEIGLTSFGLVIDGRFDEKVEDPRVALKVGVRADVYSMREREFVPESSGGWEYLGTPRRVSELTAENGRLLNQEIERAARSLAQRIVN